MTLLAELPELGTLGRKQIAALVGVAPQPGQRSPSRQARRLGRQGASPRRTLHGGAGGEPLEPGDPGLLSAPAGSRQAEEAGPDGLYAEAAGHTELLGEDRRALEPGSQNPLTSKTAAFRWPSTPQWPTLAPPQFR